MRIQMLKQAHEIMGYSLEWQLKQKWGGKGKFWVNGPCTITIVLLVIRVLYCVKNYFSVIYLEILTLQALICFLKVYCNLWRPNLVTCRWDMGLWRWTRSSYYLFVHNYSFEGMDNPDGKRGSWWDWYTLLMVLEHSDGWWLICG